MELKQILEGKGIIIKNSKEYYPTKNYVEPFIDKLSKITDNFKFEVKTPNQMTTLSNTLDITFNKVLVQAILPELFSFDGIDQSITMVYALDVRKPSVKFYRSGVDKDTSAIYILDKNNLSIQEIEPECPFDFTPVKNLLERTDDLEVKIKELKAKSLFRDLDSINYNLGLWIHKSIYYNYDNGITQKVKISISDIISAYKSLFVDSDSKHYIDKSSNYSMFDVYKAVTDIVSNDKDIFNKAEKVLLAKNILTK